MWIIQLQNSNNKNSVGGSSGVPSGSRRETRSTGQAGVFLSARASLLRRPLLLVVIAMYIHITIPRVVHMVHGGWPARGPAIRRLAAPHAPSPMSPPSPFTTHSHLTLTNQTHHLSTPPHMSHICRTSHTAATLYTLPFLQNCPLCVSNPLASKT